MTEKYFIPASEVEKIQADLMALLKDAGALFDTLDKSIVWLNPTARKDYRIQKRTLMFTLLELKGKYEIDIKSP